MTKKLISTTLLVCSIAPAFGGTYYVATNGNDSTGNGSASAPWKTLATAVIKVPDDGSTIYVKAGVYNGRVRLNRRFAVRTYLKAETPYQTIIQSNDNTSPVVTVYGGGNFEMNGFQFMRPTPNDKGVILVHVQTSGQTAQDITFRDNIFHDSYNNDLLKINNGATRIQVLGNVFYNQAGYDEHIDINGVTNVEVTGNIFFNDFAGSGRSNGNNTGSFVVIKNSGNLPATSGITVSRNVFLNWQGGPSASAVTVGEDGTSYFEAEDVLVENNLIVGNSGNTMSAPFTVQGSRRVKFRANTITGDLPARSYGMNVFISGSNRVNEDITFYNNIWSDPTGTMNTFSNSTSSWSIRRVLKNNLYWNGGNSIPVNTSAINVNEDSAKLVGDPLLIRQTGLVLPRWKGTQFLSGNTSIRGEFRRLAESYGRLGVGSPAIGRADRTEMPAVDIMGRQRGPTYDIGCWNSTAVNPTSAKVPILEGVVGLSGAPIKAGAVAEVSGLDLALFTVSATAPFPTALAGTSVFVDEIPMPITFISPTRVMFVMPSPLPTNRKMRVELNGVWSDLLPF